MRRASILSGLPDVPIGWNVVHKEASRNDCLQYVENNWEDLNPKSNQVGKKY